MKIAEILHVENRTEFYKDGSLYMPSYSEALHFALFPEFSSLQKVSAIFETVIDSFSCNSLREAVSIFNARVKAGEYYFIDDINELQIKFA